MVVNDLDVMRVIFLPKETDTPLVIDPNAVLTRAVALERLKMITRRGSQVIQPGTGVKHSQLSASSAQYVLGETLG